LSRTCGWRMQQTKKICSVPAGYCRTIPKAVQQNMCRLAQRHQTKKNHAAEHNAEHANIVETVQNTAKQILNATDDAS